MRPPLGNDLVPKHPALSLTKLSAPNLWMRPEYTRSPVLAMMLPVRMKTPSSTCFCPKVGANCRGGGTTDAMGRLKLGAEWVLVVTGKGVHGRAMHEEQEELSRLRDSIDSRRLQVLLEL